MCEHTRLNSYLTDKGYDFNVLFNSCFELFSKSDYVVANLETPVAGKALEYSYKNYNFNTPAEILVGLKNANVSLVTTANNHALDRGIVGVDRTIDNIIESGLEFTGTSKSNERRKPIIKDFDGIKVGFMSYTYGTEACYNGCYLKSKEQYRVNLIQNQELYNPLQRYVVRSKSIIAKGMRFAIKLFSPNYFNRGVEEYPQSNYKQKRNIAKDIEFCRKEQAELVIICLHIGGQFNDTPTQFTEQFVDYLHKEGVDIVIGNHEHLIQKAEFTQDGKDVAYCLGNFTSNYGIDREPYDKDSRCSVLCHLYLCKENDKLTRRWAFSIMLSMKNLEGQIITKPLFDAYIACVDEKQKEELLRLNTSSIERFIGRKLFRSVVPEREYDFSDFDV